MVLHIDSEHKIITGSIKNFTEHFTNNQATSTLGLLNSLRAELGQHVHRLYAKTRFSEHQKAFQKEVPINLNLCLAGWQLQLHGRADGLIISSQETAILEEVKSLALSPLQIDRLGGEQLQPFFWQLALYKLALENQFGQLRSQLVLYSLQDYSALIRPLEISGEEILQTISVWLGRLDDETGKISLKKQERAKLAGKLIFPYQNTREAQQLLISHITKGLWEKRAVLAMAPTGTGKTAAALFPALQYALQNNCRICFTTAKSTQRAMAARTFSDIIAASGLKNELHAFTLQPKEQLCPTGHLLCHSLTCPYLRNFKERLAQSGLLDELLAQSAIISGEEAYQKAADLTLCPYELAIVLCHSCDLIIGDYNHLYDYHPFRGTTTGEFENPPLAIIDEAHNLFDRVRETYSPRLSEEMLETADNIVKLTCLKKGAATRQLALKIEAAEMYQDEVLGQKLLEFLEKCRVFIKQLQAEGPAAAETAISNCFRVVPNMQKLGFLVEEAAELLIRYSLFRKIARQSGPGDMVQEVLEQVIRIGDLTLAEEEEIIPYVDISKSQGALGIICLSPAHRLAAMHSRLSGTIAISATLNPLSYFAEVLGFFQNPLMVEVPSPFLADNRLVVIDSSVTTTYQKRAANYQAIAQSIKSAVAGKTGNYMVFFPSFAFLENVAKELTDPPYPLYKQKDKMSPAERADIIGQFHFRRGLILFAVMGGIFAEGIDLPGDDLIGVIIVGPGLPQIGFERSLMAKYFQDKAEAGFAYSMLFPGMQKVVQAAGRVIRTMEDRGIIVLLDKRFADHPYADALPCWWYEDNASELVTSDLAATVRLFWEGKHCGRPKIVRRKEDNFSDFTYDYYDAAQYWPE